MLALQAEEGEGSGNPSEPQQPPSTAQSTNEEQIPNVSSSSHQKTQLPRQALNKDIELPQTSVPIPNVADEAVYEEWDDRVERAATIDASLDAAQGSCGSPMRQETMGVPLLKLGNHTLQQLKRYSFDDLKELFETTMKRVSTFVPMKTEVRGRASELEVGSSKRAAEVELVHESSKRKKTDEASGLVQEQLDEEELSQEDLQQMMMVVPVEEVYVEALQVKYPIIGWEVYIEESKKYWKIIRVDPIDDKERTLWVELKRLFKPDKDDTLWKLQRYMHDPLVWRLYDTCGVHHVSSVRVHDIFMLVEKDYPLTRGLLIVMMANKLQVEQSSEMANELLRKIFILANKPRQ
ncbi:hypothetical protein Tco_1485161 [Tanacetum coccineum]